MKEDIQQLLMKLLQATMILPNCNVCRLYLKEKIFTVSFGVMKWDLTMSVFGLESWLVGYEQEMLFQRTLVLGTDKQPSLASTAGGSNTFY